MFVTSHSGRDVLLDTGFVRTDYRRLQHTFDLDGVPDGSVLTAYLRLTNRAGEGGVVA